MLLIALIGLASFAVYWFFLRSMELWKQKGVNHVKPVPFFGNFTANFFQRESFTDAATRIYKSFPGERYCGVYQFTRPILMIRDPELIKQIGIKEFDKFRDHSNFSSDDIDPLWSRNLFSSKGQRWHDLRSTLSPTFTGSKMRIMFVLMQECAKSFIGYFDEKKEDLVEAEMKDVFSRFANDVIATCAFGIQCDSLRDRKNEFYMRGLEATDFSGLKGFKFLGYLISPTLMKLFNVRVFSESIGNFFTNLVRETITLRREKGIIRPDMIHLFLEAGKNDKRGVLSTEEDITAQALIFFFAGFETISTMMVFLTYELAMNQEIQERLRADIEDAVGERDGEFNYEVLMKIKYLDMVINESLRKWPGNIAIDRVCNTPFTIEPKKPGERPLTIEPGTLVWLAQYPLHRDPEYYPNPDKFDPERFSDENKDKINPEIFLTFGIGPRNCIGSRFAIMEMKILLATILLKYDIVPVKDTPISLVLSTKHFLAFPKNGMPLGFKRRTTA